MHEEFKPGLQRKFSIIGLVVVILLIAGLTYYVTSFFTSPLPTKEEELPPPSATHPTLPPLPTEEVTVKAKKEQFLYVISETAKEVAVINTTSDKIINRVGLPPAPQFAFYDKTEKRLYTSHPEEYLISVLNVNNPSTIRKIELDDRPGDLIVVNQMIYAIMPELNQVYIIDPLTEIIEKEITVGKQPRRLTLSSDQKKIYITNYRSETVSILNININAVVDTIRLKRAPSAIAINPTERYLYITHELNSEITVVPLRQQKEERPIPVNNNPNAIAFTPNDQIALITNEGSNSVSFISITKEELLEDVEVGAAPVDVVITNDGKKAYVANKNDNTLSIIDIENKEVVGEIQVGNNPVVLLLVDR